MLLRRSSPRRRAASLVEAALSYSVIFLLTFGVIVVAMGVYYQQQTASLAREGARWASVHGYQYNQDTGGAMATSANVKSNAVVPMAAGLDTNQLTVSVSWDNAGELAVYNDTSGNPQTNYVHVTVSYNWTPLLYLSPMTLSSTSVMAMQY
jgi:hypothetical protein